VTGGDRFSILIGDFFALYNRVVQRRTAEPEWVAATCRRTLAVLRAYQPTDEGQEILIETAIEQFQELLGRMGSR
jgi:hypothetical protein